ncbi:hypothetical protein ACFQ08_00040 [Streptosporangium algeriense]|uniref:Uncharacterized protein n=1 Tax=Streptosporangium algeriense TaxID=1682748 RepID=A0ABW3DGG9_9ACTN
MAFTRAVNLAWKLVAAARPRPASCATPDSEFLWRYPADRWTSVAALANARMSGVSLEVRQPKIRPGHEQSRPPRWYPGADPVLVAQWMAETQAQRVAAEANLRQRGDRRRMTREEIDVMATAIGDLAQALPEADPNDKADAHAQIGLRPAYQPRKKLVEARVQPGLHMCERYVSEGGTLDTYMPFAASTTLVLPGREG